MACKLTTPPSARENLNAFCNRLPTAASIRSRSASSASVGSTAGALNRQPRLCASIVAESLISAMNSARENRCRCAGMPAVMRTSARDRSISLPMLASARSSTPAVAPLAPTFPPLIALCASLAANSMLRSSCAKIPRRSFSAWACRSAASRSRWRVYSVTALAMALSRQRFRVLNSSTPICAPVSKAKSEMAWHRSP
ncbi:hypothetical protein D9M69_595020 [compost metagenome]